MNINIKHDDLQWYMAMFNCFLNLITTYIKSMYGLKYVHVFTLF